MSSIEEDNKLIAEFMGRCGKLWKHLYWVNIEGIKWITIQEMKFHDSWDWLMPVVEKIEMTTFILKDKTHTNCWILTSYDNRDEFIGWEVQIEAEQLRKKFYKEERSKTKIEATYTAVVKFIKWYNQNKK